MPNVLQPHDACAPLDRPWVIGGRIIGDEGRHHERGFHFNGSGGGEDASATAIEELIVFEECYGVDCGIEGCGAGLKERVRGAEVGEQGGLVLIVEGWGEGGSFEGACATMDY